MPDITIDVLTVNGAHLLDVDETASLRVLTDFTQLQGWTNVDGLLHTGEAFIGAGFLTGSGTLRAPYLTTAAAIVAPGGADNFGTLTVDGNMIMASASALYIDASRDGNDMLDVTGFLLLSDPNDPGSTGPSLVFNKAGKAPRHGQTITVANADGGVVGTFGTVYSFQGVLRPELTYGPNSVVAELRAGALVEMIGQNDATARAFASALDQLREGSYNSLWDLYGAIDVMDAATLTATLSSLAPQTSGEGQMLRQRQSDKLFGTVANRLSVMGSGSSGSMSVSGSPYAMMLNGAGQASQELRSGFASLAPAKQNQMNLPEGFSGFVSGGIDTAESGLGVRDAASQGQQSRYFSAGLESELGARSTFGVAFGHAEGRSEAAGGLVRSNVSQIAAYGAYQIGGGAYVGGVASYETAQTRSERLAFNGIRESIMYGSSDNRRFAAMAEAGVNLPISRGLTLTPRAQLGYSHTAYANLDEAGGETALRIDSYASERVESRFGAKLAGSQTVAGGWTLVPEIQADYVRLLDGADDGLTVRFAAADHVAIALPGAGGDNAWGEVRGGLKFGNGKVEFGAGLETSVGRENLRNDRAMADVKIRF